MCDDLNHRLRLSAVDSLAPTLFTFALTSTRQPWARAEQAKAQLQSGGQEFLLLLTILGCLDLPWFALACQACHDDFIHLHSAYSALYSVKLCWELGASMNFRHRMESQPRQPQNRRIQPLPCQWTGERQGWQGLLGRLGCRLMLPDFDGDRASIPDSSGALSPEASYFGGLFDSFIFETPKTSESRDRWWQVISKPLLSSLWGINLECRYPTCQPKGANSDSNSASHFLRWGDSSVYIQLLGVIRYWERNGLEVSQSDSLQDSIL